MRSQNPKHSQHSVKYVAQTEDTVLNKCKVVSFSGKAKEKT
jgi:hypothetical protein